MDINKTYSNPKLEARRRLTIQRNQADQALRRRKQRAATAREQILAAFEGRDIGPVSDVLLRNLGTRTLRLGAAVRDAMRRLFLRVEDQSSLLDRADYARAIAQLARRYQDWLRPPEDWVARSHNTRRQFASLARHLLARYDVPSFMDAACIGYDPDFDLHQQWFVHIGRGDNIRKAPGLPVPLTKMMAHHFLLAPAECTIKQAVRWGQLRGANIPWRIAREVLASRLGDEFAAPDREQFWAAVFNFFALHPTLDPHQVGPIIDYLHHQKFVPVGRVNIGGTFIEQGPPQPGLSMKGRTPDALVQQVNAWHHRLRRTREARDATWPTCGIPGYDRIEGEAGNQRRFFITELLDTAELRAEGAAMRHCVGTYAWSCQSGRTAIFSLNADDGSGPYRRLTIEVDLRTRQITQARGKYNAPATPLDQRVLHAWATTARLRISRFALPTR